MARNIGNIHKITGAAALLVIAAQILVYFYILRPKFAEVQKAGNALKSAQSDLRKNNWPANIGVLSSIKREYKDRLEGDDEDGASLAALTEKANSKASSTFQTMISRDYSSIGEFMRNASRLDYQAEHNRVFSDIAKRGFVLNPVAVGLDENASSPYIYQLLLQLWTLEKVLNLVADSGLALQPIQVEPQKDKRGNVRNGGDEGEGSSVCVMPMKTFVMKKPGPYLLEFPIALKLRGCLSSAMDLMSKLEGEGVFIPVSSFEMLALPPARMERGADGNLVSGNMDFNLVCSSFLPLRK